MECFSHKVFFDESKHLIIDLDISSSFPPNLRNLKKKKLKKKLFEQ